MGRSEGKNGSFIAIRMRIHQNCSSSMTPSEAGGYAQISDCYVLCMLCAMMYLKTKTQQRHHLSSFLQLLQMFKCLGNVLDSVTPITVCNIEVPSFGRFL